MKDIKDSGLSRRRFLQKSASVTFILTAGGLGTSLFTRRTETTEETQVISAWVRIESNGTITILNPAAEMGQGSMTALATIIAEEMDADWAKVRIIDSPIEPETYGMQWGGKLGGPMITVGSRTVRGYYTALRLAGAQVRKVLMAEAARIWKVPMLEVTTEPGMVVHNSSGKKLSYGDIAATLKTPVNLPEVSEADLKDPAAFRLVGKGGNRFDIPAKVDGTASYSIDIQLPGMLYAVIARSPVFGSKPVLTNKNEVLAQRGIFQVVELDHGIGFIGENYELCQKARKIARIEWSTGNKANGYDSRIAFDRYEKSFSDGSNGEVLQKEGMGEQAFTEVGNTFEAIYLNDFVYHAQMEPLNALVSVSEDGKSAEAWVGSQAHDSARRAIAKVLDIPFESVKYHSCYLGGGFGRRSLTDYVEEAALLSKAVKKPVKLIWSREDDVQYGAFRPICVQKMRAKVDSSGLIRAWSHQITGTGDGLLASGAKNPYYSIDDLYIELKNFDEGVRTKHWRAVGHGPNKYAIETFIDEVSRQVGKDPLDMRRHLMRNHPRELAVLNKVAEMSAWGARNIPADRARGIAFAERSGALVAGVAEISVDRSSGQIKVHQFWCAMDAGVVVQKDNSLAQLEGGLLFGISSVLHESITFRDGQVEQSNFHNYHLARFSDMPEKLHLEIIPSQEAPQGIGEASTPVVGGAIANAFLALTGRSLRHMPFTREKVREVLAV